MRGDKTGNNLASGNGMKRRSFMKRAAAALGIASLGTSAQAAMVNAQNHDIMAEIARGTHLPIATGERVFTKWGFREVLEKGAASILQPDLSHAGGDPRDSHHCRYGRVLLCCHRAA